MSVIAQIFVALWADDETGANLAELVFAKFGYAWLGLLVLLAIAAYLWAARQRARAVERLGNPALLARLLATVDPGKRLIRALLAVLALAATILGMMRLQYGGKAKVTPTRGLDIVLAVDYSKSMLAQDVYPSRSERLEAELTRFLDESGRRGDRVGVVVFAGEARAFPLTSDMGVLSLFLSHADPRYENPGGTAIGKALDKSIELLVAVRRDGAGGPDDAPGEPELLPGDEGEVIEQADQIIILLTDGEDTIGRPLELAQRAAQLGIRIYPVGIGSTSGEPVLRYDENGESTGYATDADGKPQMTRLDAETLEALAKATKGEYVHVDAERFGLDEVRGLVEGLAAAQREHSIEIHREEGFLFFLIPAVLLLSGALAIGDRRRPPAQRRDAHVKGPRPQPEVQS
ncbi:von Willebrand factor type A domain protein [Enhygromyxa salina]|uniref:von Willebrand factor type A domain protein n=1 Tax=Enhygromyxa salina TaxID=215803 RepID=A0A2S9YEH0_9BACT|nr:VWA domain-containing protein [Enhygromyxa salina]PRQ03517.1 von Willebrand factor type A domain protein [Enhygromyxa salina]